ncbi:CAP domain-containing protein [Candidatus Roizmanbacteria bacterium]|nr:CAP domain-containing protein [Candidatus Roizmanbacteria bacterium]
MKRIGIFFHHFFTPHEGNNFKARVFHTDFLTAYLVFALLLSLSVKQLTINAPSVLSFATDITVSKLFELTNQERTKAHVGSLTYNEKLAEAAYKKAQDMFNRNYWAHYGPNGTTPWEFLMSSGYNYEFAGENLAKNFLFSQGVVDAWMKSKSHKENVLRSDYSEVGFAVTNGILNGEQTTLVVQMFGKPSTSTIVNRYPQKKQLPTSHEVLAEKTTRPVFTVARFMYGTNILFVALLLFAIILDIYFITKMRILRIGGKSFAHLLFLGFILIGLLVLSRGAIL